MTNEEKHKKAKSEMEALQAHVGKEISVVARKGCEQPYTREGILSSVTPFGGIDIQENHIYGGFMVFIGVNNLTLSITDKTSGTVLYANPDVVWTEKNWDKYEEHMNNLREQKYGTTEYSVKL